MYDQKSVETTILDYIFFFKRNIAKQRFKVTQYDSEAEEERFLCTTSTAVTGLFSVQAQS